MGHVELSDIQMSDQLRDEIAMWDKKYQETFSDYYSPDSGFESDGDRASHNLQGKELATRLQKELKGVAFVEFLPIQAARR